MNFRNIIIITVSTLVGVAVFLAQMERNPMYALPNDWRLGSTVYENVAQINLDNEPPGSYLVRYVSGRWCIVWVENGEVFALVKSEESRLFATWRLTEECQRYEQPESFRRIILPKEHHDEPNYPRNHNGLQ